MDNEKKHIKYESKDKKKDKLSDDEFINMNGYIKFIICMVIVTAIIFIIKWK